MTGLVVDFRGVRPRFAGDVFVAATAAVVGDVHVGAQSSLWFGVVVRGDVNCVRIGARTNIQDGTVVHVASDGQGTFIGDGVTVGHLALLHACIVEDGAFIGMKACVMDGARVESGAMVAAGALVTPGRRVASGELWSGVPARMTRPLRDDERAGIARSAARYAELAAHYLERS